MVRVVPPVLPIALRGGTRLSGLYVCEPFEGELSPMDVTVLALTHRGRGRMNATVDGKCRASYPRVRAVTVIPQGMSGHWRLEGRALVSNLFLGNDRLLQCADQMIEGRGFEIRYGNDVADDKMSYILHALSIEVQQPVHHSLLFLEQGVELACMQLLRAHSSVPDLGPRCWRGLTAQQVRRVTDYMREHLSEEVTLQSLADLLGLSRFHFCSAFKAATRHPPYAYLTTLRMQAAAVLLLQTQCSVLDVALSVGYQTQAAFSAVFRRTMGVSPSRYRLEVVR